MSFVYVTITTTLSTLSIFNRFFVWSEPCSDKLSVQKMESDSDTTPTTPRKKAKLSKVKQKYKHEWECQYDWLTSDPLCEYNAKCKMCALTFTISHAGVGQVRNFRLHLA